jgi:hypothetical protein
MWNNSCVLCGLEIHPELRQSTFRRYGRKAVPGALSAHTRTQTSSEQKKTEDVMKAFSKLYKGNLMLIAALVCMIAASSISALAVPPNEGFYTYTGQNLSGPCCFSWNDTVTVTEPSAITAVVLTWSTEYVAHAFYLVGLSVNNGPCTAYGPRTLTPTLQGGQVETTNFQWVVPKSVLVKGNNTFTVCGGEVSPSSPPIQLGIRSFAARLSK